MRRGPWHPWNVKPVHVGWYETKSPVLNVPPRRTFWDGEYWYCRETDGTTVKHLRQYREWRGVIK